MPRVPVALALCLAVFVASPARDALRAQGRAARRQPVAATPAPPAPPAFAPVLDRDAARWVETTLKAFTDDELVGQVLMGRFDGTYLSADSPVFVELAALVTELHLGGFVAFGGVEPVPQVLLNPTYGPTILGQPLELAAILNRLQSAAKTPLLIGGDYEHGVGMRIHGATRFPRAMAYGAANDPALVRASARITAGEARALGVHVNFAPVADVNNNPRNPVINIRSYGEDPARVGTLAAEAVRGLQEGGVAATLKHFPGHGDTAVDTHLGLATVPHDRARLDRVELAPFRQGIEAGAAAVMVAHVEMPALDPAPGPATFSRPIVTGLLREQLGFTGLVVTDSLLMDAISAMTGPGEASVKALLAGADLLLDPANVRDAAAALKAGLANGTVPRARLLDAARRVLEYKARLGLHRVRTVDLNAVMAHVGTRPGADLARTTAERAVTLLRDDRTAVPLQTPRGGRVLYLSVLDYPRAGASRRPPARSSPSCARGGRTSRRSSCRTVRRPKSWTSSARWPAATTPSCSACSCVPPAVAAGWISGRGWCACCRTCRPRRPAVSSRSCRCSSAVRMPPWPRRRCRRCCLRTTSATTPKRRRCGRWPARSRSRAACRSPSARAWRWASAFSGPARRRLDDCHGRKLW